MTLQEHHIRIHDTIPAEWEGMSHLGTNIRDQIQFDFGCILANDDIFQTINNVQSHITNIQDENRRHTIIRNISLRRIAINLLHKGFTLTDREISNPYIDFSNSEDEEAYRRATQFPLRSLSVVEEVYVGFCMTHDMRPGALRTPQNYSAKEILVVANLPRVYRIASEFAESDAMLRDDLYQLGSIRLLKNVSSYDYMRDTSFGHYITRRLRNTISWHCKKQTNCTNQELFEEQTYGNGEVEDVTEDASIFRQFTFWIQTVVRVKSPRTANILMLSFGVHTGEPQTNTQIAETYHCTPQNISELITRNITKFKALLATA